MIAAEFGIGPSVVRKMEGKPFSAAQQQQRWFQFSGLPDEAAADPACLASVVVGVTADLGKIEAPATSGLLRKLRAAARMARRAVKGEEVADQSEACELEGDYRPDELQAGQWVVAAGDTFSYVYPLSRLRWLLRSQALHTLRGITEAERSVLWDALSRLDRQIAQLQDRYGRAA